MASTPSPTIPLIYKFVFLYFEPAGAILGAILLHFSPQVFLTGMAPTATSTTSNQVIYDQLAATYLLFAFNEAVLLRVTNDLKIWKTLLTGILICDCVHLYGSWAALGPEMFWNPANWRWEDVVNLGSLWGQGALRVAFLTGVGLGKEKGKRL